MWRSRSLFLLGVAWFLAVSCFILWLQWEGTGWNPQIWGMLNAVKHPGNGLALELLPWTSARAESICPSRYSESICPSRYCPLRHAGRRHLLSTHICCGTNANVNSHALEDYMALEGSLNNFRSAENIPDSL